MPEETADRQSILDALEQLLGWPEMARSPQLARFLDYIVRRTIDGDAAAIKAYSIAVDVLGRGADFDPQADPIVRVQARRLRALLDEYYRGPGFGSPVRINLPTGRYVPEFTFADMAVAAPRPLEPPVAADLRWVERRSVSWPGLVAIGVAVALLAYAIASWRQAQGPAADRPMAMQAPRLTVTEFQNLGTESTGMPMAAGLAIELVTDLDQFQEVEASYRPVSDGTIDLGSDFVLTGIVRPDGAVVQYSAILTDTAAAGVVWNRTIAIGAAEAQSASVLDAVSQELSLTLGSPRGPLHERARALLTAGGSISGLESLYLCRLLFDLYRETAAPAEAVRAASCFAALSDAERGDPTALAAVASLIADYPAPEVSAIEAEEDRLRLAADTIERALVLDSTSAFVWQQRARLQELVGDLGAAQADYESALQLNPADADTLAAYGRLLAFMGAMDLATGPALTAITETPDPPHWYYGAPALIELRRGANTLALQYAEAYVPADRELGPILAILAGLRAFNNATVNRYLPEVLDLPSFRASGVLPRLRERIADAALIEEIRQGLAEAGVPDAALERPF